MKKSVLGLGRGLDALITMDEIKAGGSSSISEIELSQIKPNPDQPRREFDPEALEELASSIRSIGIIQPITLRDSADGTYQIIAGERRYRASLLAGKTTIPAYIRTAEDDSVVEMALIENIQREDLNPIEIALAYQKLIEQYGLTQEQLSERVGKNRATIANHLRLLRLPAEIQLGLKNKQIDNGHARALLALAEPAQQLALYDETVAAGYSVRRVEERVREINAGGIEPKAPAARPANLSSDFAPLREGLEKFFNTKVQLTCNDKGRGKISFPFNSEEELQKIIDIFERLKQ
jgi:ParB family chromosome partitioning protein